MLFDSISVQVLSMFAFVFMLGQGEIVKTY